MPKNWERALFLLLVSLIVALAAMLVLSLGRSAMGQAALPTMASTSWVATPTAPVPSPTPGNGDDGVIIWPVYLPLINAQTSGGVCSIVPRSRGRIFAMLHSDPGGDGALYVKIDDELITWFSTQGRWFYVTSKRGVAVYGYDSEGNLECGG